MSFSESHLGLLDRSQLCDGKFCYLALRGKVITLWLLYKICNIVNHPMNGYLNYFVAARNSRASVTLVAWVLVIPRFLPDAVCL